MHLLGRRRFSGGMERPGQFSTFTISGPAMPPAASVENNGEAGGPVGEPLDKPRAFHRFTAALVLEAPTP